MAPLAATSPAGATASGLPRQSASRAALPLAPWVALLTASLMACSVPTVLPGESREQVLQARGAPTARYALPGSGERLEYASGPFGRTTWMIDLDAQGRVQQVRQVLDEANLAEFQGRAPGMTREQVLRELGRPADRQGIGWMGGEFWSWRFPTGRCLWFQVDFTADGRAKSAGYATDPMCDAPSDSGDRP